MALGGGNPIPFHVGGGRTCPEATYDFLKQCVGIGGSAEDGTIEAEWRFARARGLAASGAMDRALYQFFPHLSTDAIPIYEQLLSITPSPTESEEERRQKISDRWVKVLNAVSSDIEAELKAIHEDFQVVTVDWKYAAVTVPGRYFEDHNTGHADACGPAFGGGRTHTAFPNYSNHFMCYVQFVAAGQLTEEQKRLINRAKDVLTRALPAWVGFQISQITSISGDGFILDLSLLDLGAFNV